MTTGSLPEKGVFQRMLYSPSVRKGKARNGGQKLKQSLEEGLHTAAASLIPPRMRNDTAHSGLGAPTLHSSVIKKTPHKLPIGQSVEQQLGWDHYFVW